MNLIFDMDDTLSRTGDYIKQELIDYCLEVGNYDYLKELGRYATADLFSLPPYLRKIIDTSIIPRELYMLHSKPTRLFCYFFLIPGNVSSNIRISICSMRGITPNGMKKTKQWLSVYQPCVDIKDIHILDPNKTPSKLEYLENVYGDDFLLIDDNPFYKFADTPYEKDRRVAVFEECARYNQNSLQNKIIYDRGHYRINGEVVGKINRPL